MRRGYLGFFKVAQIILMMACCGDAGEPETCKDMPKLSLGDGNTIPGVGLGLYYTPPGAATYDIVAEALKIGYRHLDTAGFYENEEDVGRAVKDCGVPREQIHITSKVWPGEDGLWLTDGYTAVLDHVKESVKKLGTHADLYLIHAPFNPPQRINYYRALEEAQKLGLVKSIGVSNYGIKHIQELLDSPLTSVVPAANEVEMSPFLRKDAIDAFCQKLGIRLIAYSPLARAHRMDNPVLNTVAKKHSVGVMQILVRWSMQHGYVPLPKSVKAHRIKQNIDVLGFELDGEDMAALDGLDEQFFTEWEEWGNLDPTALP